MQPPEIAPFQSDANPAPADALRLGILGTAHIARQVAAACSGSSKVKVTAVGSRQRERAQAFAAAHGIERSYGDYDDLLRAPAVDAVYVALPNSLHAEWAIRAAEAGKHVLCEKPLATCANEAMSMFAAARASGVRLLEAYPYLAQPQSIELCRLVADRAIGAIRLIQATFSFPMPAVGNIRLDPALGGGSLLDAGSYPVSLVRRLAGAAPVRVDASSRHSQAGVDVATVAILEHADGLLAQVACAFGTAPKRYAIITGDSGALETSYANHTSGSNPPVLQLTRGGTWDAPSGPITLTAGNGFLAEVEQFADSIRYGGGGWTGATESESLDIARTLDAIRLSAREARRITLDI